MSAPVASIVLPDAGIADGSLSPAQTPEGQSEVAVNTPNPDKKYTQLEQELKKFLDRKEVASVPVFKARQKIDQGEPVNHKSMLKSPWARFCAKVKMRADSPTNNSKLHKKSRINSENMLALAALRFFVNYEVRGSKLSPEDILKLCSAESLNFLKKNDSDKDQLPTDPACKAAWLAFKNSKIGREAANHFDYKFTHLDDFGKKKPGFVQVCLMNLSKYCYRMGELIVGRSSAGNQTLQSGLGGAGRTTPLTHPTYATTVSMTNILGCAIRAVKQFQGVITATVINSTFFTFSYLFARAAQSVSNRNKKPELSNDDLLIARHRLSELLDNLAMTKLFMGQEAAMIRDGDAMANDSVDDDSQQENDSTHQLLSKPAPENNYKTLVEEYIQHQIHQSSRTLGSRFTHFCHGKHRASMGKTAPEYKSDVADRLLGDHDQLKPQSTHKLTAKDIDEVKSGIVTQIAHERDNAELASSGNIFSYNKGLDYVFSAIHACANLSSNGTQNIQSVVVEGTHAHTVVEDEVRRLENNLQDKLGDLNRAKLSASAALARLKVPLSSKDLESLKDEENGVGPYKYNILDVNNDIFQNENEKNIKKKFVSQAQKTIDANWADRLSDTFYNKIKMPFVYGMASRIAPEALNVSSSDLKDKDSKIQFYRQQFARWMTYDPTKTQTQYKDSSDNIALVDKPICAIDLTLRKTRYLNYALKNPEDYIAPVSLLLKFTDKSFYAVNKLIMGMTGAAGRINDQILRRIKSKESDGFYMHAIAGATMGTAGWACINTCAYPLGGALGLSLFSLSPVAVVATSALALTVLVPVVLPAAVFSAAYIYGASFCSYNLTLKSAQAKRDATKLFNVEIRKAREAKPSAIKKIIEENINSMLTKENKKLIISPAFKNATYKNALVKKISEDIKEAPVGERKGLTGFLNDHVVNQNQ